jgi:C-terminal processing protease CtpA/Prc
MFRKERCHLSPSFERKKELFSMTNFLRKWSKGSESGAGEQARRIQAERAMRVFIIAVAITALATVGVTVALFRPGAHDGVPAAQKRGTQAFSPNFSVDEALGYVKQARAAYKLFIKRDRVDPRIEAIEQEFLSRKTLCEADLFQMYRHFGEASTDDYFAIVPNERYQHVKALMRGATIGIEITITYEAQTNSWVVGTVKENSQAQREGIQVGDRVVAFDDWLIPANVGNPIQFQQAIAQFLSQGGLLDSKVKLTVERKDAKDDKKTTKLDIFLTRVVLSEAPPFAIADYSNPVEGGKQKDIQEITFRHIESETVVQDLFTELVKMSQVDGGLKGLIVDLRNLQAGDADKAVQIVAMFLNEGVLSHRMEVTTEGELLIKTYVIEAGKVHLKTWGPYKIEVNGAIDPAAGKRDPNRPNKDEVLPWPVGVVDAPIIAVAGRNTGGAGEVIAAAFRHQWESTTPKHAELAAHFLSQGTSMGRTFYPVLGGTFWLQVSTSYHLAPDGTKIDTFIARGNIVGLEPNTGIPDRVDEMVFARQLMVDRLNVIPLPDILPVGK